MTDKISVIMSCYNCEKTLHKAIDSILEQTYTNWVLICCNDGSLDGTLDVLNDYKEKYPDKFVIINNDGNKKLPYSLNHCLRYVETEFVARMDADDWSMPERFEHQIRFLKEHPEYDLVGTAMTAFDGKKKIASIVKIAEPNKYTMLKENAFCHATIMTYKRVYDALNGYCLEDYAVRVEDVDLWCRFLAAGFKGYNLPDELYVILENEDAVKRRTFQARLNSARTRRRGYKLMGFKGATLYKPYLNVFRAFVPAKLQKWLHSIILKNAEKKKQSK